MGVPDQYRGREQTYFKHRLLEAYLERLFMIVGHRADHLLRRLFCRTMGGAG